jgi:hypothetical protein
MAAATAVAPPTAAAPTAPSTTTTTIAHSDVTISLHQPAEALHADIWRFCTSTLAGWAGLAIEDAKVRA